MQRPTPVIGVATSVGWNGRTFDTFAALAYARQHGFPLVQVYLNPELIVSAAARQDVVRHAEGLRLLCHAPALLGDGPGTAPEVTAAALDLLRDEPVKWVVHHFDEGQPVEITLAWVERLLAVGLVPCIENFHATLDRAAALRQYVNYLALFCRLRERNHEVPAVIDIPRLFDQRLDLTSAEASDTTVHVFYELARLGVPVVLHLIDSASRAVADRQAWCPVGAGVLGYPELLPRLLAAGLDVPAVILEFDDRSSPLASRTYLKTLFDQSAR